MAERMQIGRVANEAGVSIDTVRFYERRGLLPAPARRASGYRQYSQATIERIRFAKALQGLGFTLDEVVAVLGDVDTGIASCARERPQFESVLDRIDRKIAELGAIRRDLLGTLKRCRDGRCTFREKSRVSRGTSRRSRERPSR